MVTTNGEHHRRMNERSGRDIRQMLTQAVLFGLTGAAGTLLLTVGFNVQRVLSEGLSLQALLSSLVAGFLLGGLLELLLELFRATSELVGETRQLADSVRVQHEVLDLLKNAKKHAASIGPLLAEDSTARFQVTGVNGARYLEFIKPVLQHSDSFQAVQRSPLGWFATTTGGTDYLECLKERKMKKKIRIFVIDPKDDAQMTEDVSNEGTLSDYFKSTGDVRTYWIPTDRLQENGVPPPDDFALLDSELMITWDGKSMLTFRFVHAKSKELEVFRVLEQLGASKQGPFKPITRPRTPRGPERLGEARPDTEVTAVSVADGSGPGL